MKSKQKIYSIASIVIMVDLILKFIVSAKLVENDIIKVIPNFFSIYYLKKEFEENEKSYLPKHKTKVHKKD